MVEASYAPWTLPLFETKWLRERPRTCLPSARIIVLVVVESSSIHFCSWAGFFCFTPRTPIKELWCSKSESTRSLRPRLITRRSQGWGGSEAGHLFLIYDSWGSEAAGRYLHWSRAALETDFMAYTQIDWWVSRWRGQTIFMQLASLTWSPGFTGLRSTTWPRNEPRALMTASDLC